MPIRISTFALIVLVGLTVCRAEEPVEVKTAQTRLAEAWQVDQHILWEIEWPAMPVGGPLIVETWRTQDRYRYEILEATAPALIGETLIFDGQTGWQYNHFKREASVQPVSEPWLSPVSEIFALIDDLIARQAIQANHSTTTLAHGSAQAITLHFDHGDRLTLWRDDRTGLPVRVRFSSGDREGWLTAREFEPLLIPPPALFSPPLSQ